MCVEGVGDVQVVCNEGAQPGLAFVDGAGVGCAAEGYVCAAGVGVNIHSGIDGPGCWLQACGKAMAVCANLRGKESALACQYRDEDFLVFSDFVHCSRELVVRVSAHGVELLGDIERDDGELAAVLDEDGFFFLRHDCGN